MLRHAGAESARETAGARRALSLRRVLAAAAPLLICPCHVLYGAAALAAGVAGLAAPLAPEVQDGLHAVYLPLAGIGAALWLRRGARQAAEREGPAQPPPDAASA